MFGCCHDSIWLMSAVVAAATFRSSVSESVPSWSMMFSAFIDCVPSGAETQPLQRWEERPASAVSAPRIMPHTREGKVRLFAVRPGKPLNLCPCGRSPCGGMSLSPKLSDGLVATTLAFPISLFNRSPQSVGLRGHPTVPMHSSVT